MSEISLDTGLQDRILLNYTTGLPTCLHQKKPDSSFEPYTHITCTTNTQNRHWNSSKTSIYKSNL